MFLPKIVLERLGSLKFLSLFRTTSGWHIFENHYSANIPVILK
jgi:hypothetical protein